MDFLEQAYSLNFEGIGDDGVYKYRFISPGAEDITKVISISPIAEMDNWYNLGFGNLENIDGTLVVNDTAEKNNNDYDNVLATVFMSALYFFQARPEAVIAFFGNTVHKHRMYKQKISIHLKSLKENLNISGGFLNNDINIIKKEQVVTRNGRQRKRTVKEKDIDSIIDDGIRIKCIEEYEMRNSKNYQFVLISLKKDNHLENPIK